MGFYGNATYYLPNGIAQDVVDEIITTKKLAKDAVTTAKITAEAVQGSKGTKLNEQNQQSSHIASHTIGTDDIAFDIITGGSKAGEGNIAPDTIQGYNIDSEAINTKHISSGAIFGGAIDGVDSKIKSKSINGDDIADRVITGSYDATATNPDQPGRGNIADNTIGKFNMGKDSITADSLSDGAVNGRYGTTKQHIVQESIAGGKGGDIAPSTIQGYNIDSGAVNTTHINDNAITTNKIANGQIHGSGDNHNRNHIAPNTIGTNDIANNSITEEKLANKFLKIAYYTDEQAPTTLQEIGNLLKNSYGGTNTLVTFSLVDSDDLNSATKNGLTPGYYQAYPHLMNGVSGAPGYWFLTNLSTNEHWEIQSYTQQLKKIYLNDYIDTNLKEYDSVIELKNDLDQQPMKTYIIGMQRAVSNLPSGRYIALPTHEHIGSMKPNRILIHLTTGVSYTLRTTSANTVIVSTYTGHSNTNSEWLTFNNFSKENEIQIDNKSYGSGEILLNNQYQYKDLPIHIWNQTYLVAEYNLSIRSDENFTTKCIITGKLPAIGSIKNTTGKQLQFSIGDKVPNGASLNLPNPKDLEGNEIVDSELIKNYGYQIYMELVDFDSDTILCNIQYFQGLNRDLFPGAIIS